MKKSHGAALVAELEQYFLYYMAMPVEYALVAALWVLNTWIFQTFDACPYLVISAPTMGSGKTAFGELVAMISKSCKVRTDVTPATMFRLLDAHGGKMTIAIDEAEKLRFENHPLRPFANSGYRKGQTIPRTMPDGTVKDFDVYCPKLFILIGDVWPTLRDRSIVLRLAQGKPAHRYRRSEAERMAIALTEKITDLWREVKGTDVKLVEAEWLEGRDEEIWSPLVSLASGLELSKADIDRVISASVSLTAKKLEKAQRYESANPDAEAKAQDDRYARKLLNDLVSVVNPGELKIFSSVLITRLKAIPTAPWRDYKNVGLSELSLAALVARFGLSPEQLHFENMRPGATRTERRLSAKGYKVAAIHKAARENAAGDLAQVAVAEVQS